MTNDHQISERSKEVLKSLIQLHVATGEPVGSENLSRVLSRPLSPATIRNIMAELERHGYLAHPHTSAGRVPTDDGYRIYVDSLMSHEPLGAREAAAIESGLRVGEVSMNHVLENASRLLSTLSRNVGFVLVPDIGRTSFMHVDLVRLPHPKILVVMVSRTGIVTNKVIEVEDEELSQDDLQACANYLNVHFVGKTLAEIRAHLLEMMREEKALYDSLLKRVISVGERAFDDDGQASTGNVYLDGTANIFEQPEFEDFDRMRALFKTFEEKSRLVRLLNACIAGEGLRIIIGHENPDPELKGMALVTASCPMGGEPWGLGVMGSTRMEYARMIALVDHVSRAVRKALEELGS
jgi:heat-inducible transcriptional repressor